VDVPTRVDTPRGASPAAVELTPKQELIRSQKPLFVIEFTKVRGGQRYGGRATVVLESLCEMPRVACLPKSQGATGQYEQRFCWLRRSEIMAEALRFLPARTNTWYDGLRPDSVPPLLPSQGSTGARASSATPAMLRATPDATGRGGALQPRDLRVLDPTFDSSREPALLVRRHCVVFNLPPVRALILPDKCLYFPEHGPDDEIRVILERLQRVDEDVAMPFEYHAMEAFLQLVVEKQ
jgi:hypothetical protein